MQPKIISLVRGVTQQDRDPEPDEMLFESGYLDSFALPDLVAKLETEFGISIPDADLRPRNFASVQTIQAYLEKKRG